MPITEKDNIKAGDFVVYVGDNQYWFNKNHICKVVRIFKDINTIIAYSPYRKTTGGFKFSEFERYITIKGSLKEIMNYINQIPFSFRNSKRPDLISEAVEYDLELNQFTVYSGHTKKYVQYSGDVYIYEFLPGE